MEKIMSVIGFSFSKQQVRSTVLNGTKIQPVFVSKDKSEYGENLTPTEISIWLKRNIYENINRIKPEKVVYRLSWSFKKQAQSYSLIYPCAILEICCFDLNIPCQGFGYQALTNKNLGFPKGVDAQSHCTALLGAHPPYWDNQQINSALAAIAGLD